MSSNIKALLLLYFSLRTPPTRQNVSLAHACEAHTMPFVTLAFNCQRPFKTAGPSGGSGAALSGRAKNDNAFFLSEIDAAFGKRPA
jgi:hypothetical protein